MTSSVGTIEDGTEQAQLEPPQKAYRVGLRIGDVSIRIGGADKTALTLPPSLESFRFESALPGIEIEVEWTAGLSRASRPKLFDSGSVWRLYQEDSGFRFDFSAPAFGERPYKRMLVNSTFGLAVLQMSEEYLSGADYVASPLEYPLDELLIMHRLTQESAIELHGSGIVRTNGVGNLFVGHSGAGKSTTTRLWTSREEVEVLSDDRIIVRPDQMRDGHSDLSAPGPMRMYGTPWHGEAMFASPNSAPLTRIFILEHGYGNLITRLTPSQAVGELFARAFVPFHRHEYIENAIAFLEQLVASVPCYRYSFEPDERAVEKIQHFND